MYFKKSRYFLKSTLPNHVISKKLGNLPQATYDTVDQDNFLNFVV